MGRDGDGQTRMADVSLRARLRAFSSQLVDTGTVKDVQLRIQAFVMHGNARTQITALIDTGAEVSLVKKDLFPADCFQISARPICLTGANSQTLQGGVNEALLTLEFAATDKESGREIQVRTPSLLYEAAIELDMILSYAWLAERGFDVCARRHGIQGTTEDRVIWIPGINKQERKAWSVCTLTKPPELVTVKPKRALDLFSGLGSATRVLKNHGYEVTTLDADPKYGADICANILDWDPTVFEPGHFDLIMACPPCTEYSRAMTMRPRRMDQADRVVQATLRAITHLQPEKWVLENPRGELKKRELLQ